MSLPQCGTVLGMVWVPLLDLPCVFFRSCVEVVRKTTDSQVRLHRVQISAPTLFVLYSRLMLLRLNFSSIKGGNNNTLLGR